MLSGFKESLAIEGERLPLVLEPTLSSASLVDLLDEHKETLKSKLLEHGGLLFRGFGQQSVEQFDRCIDALSRNRVEYTYRSTPRSALGKGIYTATEYPPEREIPLHNENAYQRSWPLNLAFACVTPAATGGETPIADMRRVTAAIGANLLDAFESRRVRYIRHYHPSFDLSWQDVFQTDDRAVVAEYCGANGISHEWLGATLRTVQVCQGTAEHPVTGERVFFNQAHLFHVSGLGAEMSKLMMEVFGADELPRRATYGDGQEISLADLDRIQSAFRSSAVTFSWNAGDVLLLDNMQVAHGRRPFTGERSILATLLDQYSGGSP